MGMEDEVSATAHQPPAIPTLVACFCCGEEFDSWQLQWCEGRSERELPTSMRNPKSDTTAPSGCWCCPTEGCEGAGFLVDIWPVDPEWRDENGERVQPFGLDLADLEPGSALFGNDGGPEDSALDDPDGPFAADWLDDDSLDDDLLDDSEEDDDNDDEDDDEGFVIGDEHYNFDPGGYIHHDPEMDYFDE